MLIYRKFYLKKGDVYFMVDLTSLTGITQEEFDNLPETNGKKVVSDKFVIHITIRNATCPIEFRNCNIRLITINSPAVYPFELIGSWYVAFYGCDIRVIKECGPTVPFGIRFNGCEITNYENIYRIEDYSGKYYRFDNECIFTKQPPVVCPSSGEFVGYKVGMLKDVLIRGGKTGTPCIIKLLIPSDALRSNGFSNKCRCSKASVLGIFDLNGNEMLGATYAFSPFRNRYGITRLKYIVGSEVVPNGFDEYKWRSCARGIHFFMTFNEAVDYYNEDVKLVVASGEL